jgi:hypothetical protein
VRPTLSDQPLLDFVRVNGSPRLYGNADVILVREGQDCMTMPRLSVWIRDLIVLPGEMNNGWVKLTEMLNMPAISLVVCPSE